MSKNMSSRKAQPIIRRMVHRLDRTPGLNTYLRSLANTQPDKLSERDRLIVENHGLAMAVVMQYSHLTHNIEDLLGAAMLGLCIAAERYEPSRGHSFSTYAPQWIRREVQDLLSLDAKIIRIPDKMVRLRSKVVRAQERYLSSNGREASVEEIADLLQMAPEDVAIVWEGLDFSTSLSRTVGHDDEDCYTLADVLADESTSADEDAGKELMEECAKYMTARDCEIVERHYLNEEDYRSIGDDLGLTGERVRQLAQRALRRAGIRMRLRGGD